MLFNPSQADVRRFFCELWQKHQDRAPLTPLEDMGLSWVLQHPEYHAELADLDRALAADYPVDAGRTNPFLHLSMHLAIAEQVSIDQPPGIRAAHQRLMQHRDDPHAAAHSVMDCLGETLWQAQRDRTMPDSDAYLECIRRQLP